MCYSHWINSPNHKEIKAQGPKQLGHTSPLAASHLATVQGNMPDDEEIRDAADGVPAPGLSGTLGAKGREQAAQDHDDVGDDGHQSVGTVEACEQGELQYDEGDGQDPTHVAGPVDLPADLVGVRIGAVGLVVVVDGVTVVGLAVPGGQGEIGDGGHDGHERGQHVVYPLGHGHVPRNGGKHDGGDRHDDEDHPESPVAGVTEDMPFRRGGGSGGQRGFSGVSSRDRHGRWRDFALKHGGGGGGGDGDGDDCCCRRRLMDSRRDIYTHVRMTQQTKLVGT